VPAMTLQRLRSGNRVTHTPFSRINGSIFLAYTCRRYKMRRSYRRPLNKRGPIRKLWSKNDWTANLPINLIRKAGEQRLTGGISRFSRIFRTSAPIRRFTGGGLSREGWGVRHKHDTTDLFTRQAGMDRQSFPNRSPAGPLGFHQES